MKIKKDGKIPFWTSLFVTAIIIVTIIYGYLSQNLSSIELIMDLLMLTAMATCLFKSIEKK